MDTRQQPSAVAIVDPQTNLEDVIDEVKLRQIWRWLDSVNEGEPPEEQPAFNDFGEPHNWVKNQERKSEVSQQNQQQLLPEQAEKDQASMRAFHNSTLAPKASQRYGQVQILKRFPTSRSSREPYTNSGTYLQAASGQGAHKAAPTSSDQGKSEDLDQSKSTKTFAQRAKDLASPVALYPPSAGPKNWMRRIRANSKSATHRFVKHTR